MTRAARCLGCWIWLGAIAFALTLTPAMAHQGQLCIGAIQAAERRFDLPAGLLMALALTETGRRVGDALTPWPWSINAAGQGAWLEDRRIAVERTRTLQASGVESIDVGCMQVNLKWHAGAFESVEAAFDPTTNVTYAAGYLRALRERSSDWLEAAGRYHSADPARARSYLARLSQNWRAVRDGAEGNRMLLPAAPGQIPLDFALARPVGIGPLVDLRGVRRGMPLLDRARRPRLDLVPAHAPGGAGP
jgi:hypothetical protein